MSQVILFPIFEACKKYTLDPYWQDIFTSCAVNKLPGGLRYDPKHNHVILKTTKTTKTSSEVIALSQNEQETFQIMMKIFRDRLNLRSTRDIHLQREEMETAKKSKIIELDTEWKKIKPRSIRNQLIDNFVTDLKHRHNLTAAETRVLISLIFTGQQFHQISSDDIVYEHGRIEEIRGLCFDEKRRKFYLEKDMPASSSGRNEKSASSGRFYQSVDKFLREAQHHSIVAG